MTGEKVITLVISEIFSPWAAGRHLSDGTESGEAFRENYLIPALKNPSIDKIIISFKGLIGLGSSFPEELLGGSVRKGIDPEVFKSKVVLETELPSDSKKYWSYFNDAVKKL